MCYYVKETQCVINCIDNNDNDGAMVDVYSDMPELIPVERPNLEEINKMIKLHKSMEKTEINHEFLWFLTILSICFGGVAGIMRMVYLLKR